MNVRALSMGVVLAGCALSVSTGASADKGSPPAVAVDWSISDAPCARGTIAITGKAKNGSVAFDGTLAAAPTNESWAVKLTPGENRELATKTSFHCEKTPNHLTSYTASLKNNNGVVVSTKTFNLKGFTYQKLTATPPAVVASKGSSMFVQSVTADVTCGQPMTITVNGVSQALGPDYLSIAADLEFTNATDRNKTLSISQSIAGHETFTVKLTGPVIDCAVAAPIVKFHAARGALESAPVLHAESEVWQ